MKKLYVLLLCLPLVCFAQQEKASYPRDTSYTVSSTYEKLHHQYPFINPMKRPICLSFCIFLASQAFAQMSQIVNLKIVSH